MKVIANLKVDIEELPENGLRAFVYPDEEVDRGIEIYGNTESQVCIGIRKRMEKLLKGVK